MAERMRYMEILTDSFQLMERLRPKKYKEASLAILKYQRAIETGKWDTPIPDTGDPEKDMYVQVICAHLQDKAQSWAKRCGVNADNANQRWNKERERKQKQDKPKAKAPMTLKAFEAMANQLHPGIDLERVKGLYNTLDGDGWKYHGIDLAKYCGKGYCRDECYEQGTNESAYDVPVKRCGFGAILYFNAVTGKQRGKEIFDTVCECVKGACGDRLCEACEIMNDVKPTREGYIEYTPDKTKPARIYTTLEEFANFLKSDEN